MFSTVFGPLSVWILFSQTAADTRLERNLRLGFCFGSVVMWFLSINLASFPFLAADPFDEHSPDQGPPYYVTEQRCELFGGHCCRRRQVLAGGYAEQ